MRKHDPQPLKAIKHAPQPHPRKRHRRLHREPEAQRQHVPGVLHPGAEDLAREPVMRMDEDQQFRRLQRPPDGI